MAPNLRSRVTVHPDAVTFDHGAPLPTERTYARDYSTEHLLGEGGMGKVLAARDRNLGRRVAIKELRAEVRGNPDLWGRFIREAQIGGQLEHPNIVPIYAFQFSPEGGPSFVMQLVDGESLSDYIARAQRGAKTGDPAVPTLKERVALLLPICDAIAYAHGRSVLHRDLKPDNIMLGPHNVVLVTDWGIARVEGDLEDSEELNAQDLGTLRTHVQTGPVGKQNVQKNVSSPESEEIALAMTMVTPPVGSGSAPGPVKTTLGSVLGTPQYMSPEQALGLPVGQGSDQYALGLMLLELATLNAARSHDNGPTAFAQAILGEQCEHVDLTGATLDPRLSAIISHATEKEPAARYKSVEALAQDLRGFISDEEVSVLPDSRARKFLRALQKHPVRSVSLGALLLLVLATWAVISTSSAATRATSARHDAEALSRLSSSVLGEGRAIEHYLLDMDSALVGLAQTVRVRLSDETPPKQSLSDLLQPEGFMKGKRDGVVRNAIDGTLRSYREPVFVFAPTATLEAKMDAIQLFAAKRDLIDLYLASLSETGHELPNNEQEALMAKDQTGIVRLMIALESGLFVQFPARPDFAADYDARQKDWYKHTINTGGSTFSRPKYGPLAKIPRIAVTRAIESNGRVLGVVAAGLWLQALVDRLGVRAAPQLRNAFLAAPDGKEIASRALLKRSTHGEPEAPVVLADVSSSRLRQLLTKKKETGYLVDGDSLYVYTRLAVEDWVLVHEYPRATYLKLVH